MESELDVIIIGGGVAGLSTALSIAEGKLFSKVALVEAQERVGGRTFSVTSEVEPTATVDIGGQWIGPTQFRALSYIQRFGLALEEQKFSPPTKLKDGSLRPRFIELYNTKLRPLTDDEQLELDKFESMVDSLGQVMDLDEPWMLKDAELYDSLTVHDFLSRHVKSRAVQIEIEIYVSAVLACDPAQCSFLFFLFYLASGGGVASLGDGTHSAQKWKLKGGAQQISKKLQEESVKAGVHFYFSSPVKHIERDANGYYHLTVKGFDGKLRCHRLVIAMSPAQAIHSLNFADGIISAEKCTLYNQFLPGKCAKVILVYKENFWDKENRDNTEITLDIVANEFLIWNVYSTTVGSYPALVGLITGTCADKYCNMTLEKRRVAIFQQLSKMYSVDMNLVATPLEFVEKNWCEEEFSRGCYAGSLPPFALTTYGRYLRLHENNIFWAGTELSTKFYGYIEGAIVSSDQVISALKETITEDTISKA